MKLPRVRLTTRRMMVAVGLVALAFPLSRMAVFYREHLHAALIHAEQEKLYALELKNVALVVYHPSVSPRRRRELPRASVPRCWEAPARGLEPTCSRDVHPRPNVPNP